METELQALLNRSAVKVYDSTYKIEKSELEEILTFANRAPSAWNLQHWHFLAITSDEAKEKLLPIAYNQKQITESSVTIVVLGDKQANLNVETIYGSAVENGEITEDIKNMVQKQVEAVYQNQNYAYEAAVMNATFPAMQIMNAATIKGLGTCAIGGFNRTQLEEAFQIDERFVPLMLITIGKTLKDPRTSTRRPLSEVVTYH
ncbi:nitroreductase family protein [Macrococcus sp. DPC7161]|uniref:nitroreductase family protein n=1 Tax=Macrococcus sp. DPC7161 TaxID=2507060 RepID=UPI00100B611B|nr:nitroreductase family protein [Macrococcus sp. DPC7161]RXK17324.1 nitroreductase family protein [Macrococcus sp. DPC7161]